MRRILYILTSIVLLISAASCSPQKRLAKLLAAHPELHQDSVLRIDTFFVQPADSNTINFTINDLLALLNDSGYVDKPITAYTEQDDSVSSINPSILPTSVANRQISTETSRSSANISANADGSFSLNLLQKPDTIFVHDSIDVPVYLTDTQYVETPVYQMTRWQEFMYKLGSTVFMLFVLITIFIIAKLILRHFKPL